MGPWQSDAHDTFVSALSQTPSPQPKKGQSPGHVPYDSEPSQTPSPQDGVGAQSSGHVLRLSPFAVSQMQSGAD